MQYPFIVLFTTMVWLAVTFLTPDEDRALLEGFVKSLDLSGAGWKKFGGKSQSTYLSSGLSIPYSMIATPLFIAGFQTVKSMHPITALTEI